MQDVEVPTEAYYEALAEDMMKRHPKASKDILEHLASLEAFLDVSILAGMSYGSAKALVAVIIGKLLGHMMSRSGASADPEKTQAIVEFVALKDINALRPFIGCTDWVRCCHTMDV